MKIQHTIYSILDLALVSEGHTLKQTYNDALKLVQHAETFSCKVIGSQNTIMHPTLGVVTRRY